MDFTLLRLILALSVLLSHFAELTGSPWDWARGLTSTTAVQAFFLISGWIITASYENSRSTPGFFIRRLARLYPLYAVVVVLQAVAVVAVVGLPPHAWKEVFTYLGANLVFANFLKPTLLGFVDHALVPAINPSLWTLKIEVMFYLTVPLWVWIARRFGTWGLAAMLIGSTAFFYLVEPHAPGATRQLPGQLRFFIAGMAFRLLVADKYPPERWNKPLLAGLAAIGIYFAQINDSGYVLAALQPLLILALVIGLAGLLPSIKGLPDISFGVYLVHAPLIQFANTLGLIPKDPSGLIVILPASIALAMIGHYLVEQPGIDWGQRLSRRLSFFRGGRGGPTSMMPGGA